MPITDLNETVAEQTRRRMEAAEAELDRLRMRIHDYRVMAYAETNPANIKPGETDNALMNRFAETLDKIANDGPDDGSEDWIDRFFAERDDLRARCARMEEALRAAHADLTIGNNAGAYQIVDAALSDTGEPMTVGDGGAALFEKIAADMRERTLDCIAELRIERPTTARGRGYQKACDDADAAIRALPLTEGKADEDKPPFNSGGKPCPPWW